MYFSLSDTMKDIEGIIIFHEKRAIVLRKEMLNSSRYDNKRNYKQ